MTATIAYGVRTPNGILRFQYIDGRSIQRMAAHLQLHEDLKRSVGRA